MGVGFSRPCALETDPNAKGLFLKCMLFSPFERNNMDLEDSNEGNLTLIL